MKQDIKGNLIKARFIVIGFILIAIPHSLEQFNFMATVREWLKCGYAQKDKATLIRVNKDYPETSEINKEKTVVFDENLEDVIVGMQ